MVEMDTTANPGCGSDSRCLAEVGVGEGVAGAETGLAGVVLEEGEGPNVFLPPVSASVDAPVASQRRDGSRSQPSVHVGYSNHTPSLAPFWIVG